MADGVLRPRWERRFPGPWTMRLHEALLDYLPFIGPNGLVAYAVLVWFRRSQGIVEVSTRDVAKRMCVAHNTAMAALHRLRRAGLAVVVSRTTRRAGKFDSYVYALRAPEDMLESHRTRRKNCVELKKRGACGLTVSGLEDLSK